MTDDILELVKSVDKYNDEKYTEPTMDIDDLLNELHRKGD